MHSVTGYTKFSSKYNGNVSPSTVTHGNKIFINGTAEGQPSSVAIWILGKNFANRDTETVNVDGSFSYEIKQEVTKSLYRGQYFVVVQHPGMNGVYDIDICYNNPQFVCDYSGTTPVSIFKISGPGSLQGSDAAEALIQGINQPYIDDTYTELQFQIVSSSKIGVYKDGAWYLDANGNGAWDTGVDKAFNFGASGWTSVVGDWNGDSKTEIGIYQNGIWYLDYDGSGTWNAGDKVYFFGASGWTPIVGDWNATGFTYIGVTNGQQWYLDWNGNGVWDVGTDKVYSFGASGWTPVVGKWT
jgi:hypothetical protein